MITACTFTRSGDERLGLLVPDAVVDIAEACAAHGLPRPPADTVALMAAGASGREVLATVAALGPGPWRLPVDAVGLLAPVPRPGKCLCLAVNCRSHWTEGKTAAELADLVIPDTLHVFHKDPDVAVVGPAATVTPPREALLDYELELALVIGTGGRDLDSAGAAAAIGGYAAANDLSDRRFMPTEPTWLGVDWFSMKSFDGSVPFAPGLVLAEPGLSAADLACELKVDGQVRQHLTSDDLVVGMVEIVRRLSQRLTLRPGDVILTGTPSGNGWNRRDFLADGALVELGSPAFGWTANRIRIPGP